MKGAPAWANNGSAEPFTGSAGRFRATAMYFTWASSGGSSNHGARKAGLAAVLVDHRSDAQPDVDFRAC